MTKSKAGEQPSNGQSEKSKSTEEKQNNSDYLTKKIEKEKSRIEYETERRKIEAVKEVDKEIEEWRNRENKEMENATEEEWEMRMDQTGFALVVMDGKWAVKRGYHIMGHWRFKTKREAQKWVLSRPWELIITTIMAMCMYNEHIHIENYEHIKKIKENA